MGSDMHMEMQSWRPGPNKAEWTGPDTIKVQTDSFEGYRTIYEGKVTPEVETLLKGLYVRLPEKNPVVVFSQVSATIRCSARANDVTGGLANNVDLAVAKAIRAAVSVVQRKFPDITVEMV